MGLATSCDEMEHPQKRRVFGYMYADSGSGTAWVGGGRETKVTRSRNSSVYQCGVDPVNGTKGPESVVSYVLLVRERLARMAELAQENLGRAQQQQKRWYDTNARSRTFHPGDQVLVQLPSSTNKLWAQ